MRDVYDDVDVGKVGRDQAVVLEGQVADVRVVEPPFPGGEPFDLVLQPRLLGLGVPPRQPCLAALSGGLGLATITACASFAAVSGSSVATVATVGRTAIEEMRRSGYDPAFAAGIVGAAGTLGVLIPPSIVLVLHGVVSGESIGALLRAGIVPGLLSALLNAISVALRVRRNPSLVGTRPAEQIVDELVAARRPLHTPRT
jgi:TRAP-type C4-dicarboxylate transport system permease large subunit